MSALPKLPPFIASNMTDEEFLNLLDRSECPAYVREKFAEFEREKRWAQEERDAAIRDLEDSEAKDRSDLAHYADLVDLIRVKWDALAGRIESADEETPTDVSDLERAIKEAEDFNP